MKSIQIFTEEESHITSIIKSRLQSQKNIFEYNLVDKTEKSLVKLADSISGYPSIFGEQQIGNHYRTLETLVENLCSKEDIHLLMSTPTKAILGRSFTMAKLNFFLLMSYLCKERYEICEMELNLKKIIRQNVFSILSEDVFISIISDFSLSNEIRRQAAFMLATIWENRIYHGVEKITPLLSELWEARLDFIPAYGTMVGVSEISTFIMRLNPDFIEFINDDDFSDDANKSLMEYLMELSFEELIEIQQYMTQNSQSLFKSSDIEKILKGKREYEVKNFDDPREMYNFYIRRQEKTIIRKKLNLPGPKRTIEEYIISFMLKKKIIRSVAS
ncbi:MAG TPA: hypothetical protein PKX79_06200 [Spirochaetota bacterium]|nr:hypothetical protein [Spirochaetota bacterium]